MSNYIKQNFEPGQILTAAQLNHIEEGIDNILPAIENGSTNKVLVLDETGILKWKDKDYGWVMEEQLLYKEFELIENYESVSALLKPEVGDLITAYLDNKIFTGEISRQPSNGQLWASVTDGINYLNFYNIEPGVDSMMVNPSSLTGHLRVMVRTKKYNKLDYKYLPICSVEGEAYNSINLNNMPKAKATAIVSTAANNGKATAPYTFAVNESTASAYSSFANGYKSEAKGFYSHAEGNNTIASGESQHAEGKYNIEDVENKYAHIIGNGTSYYDKGQNIITRSNAHTIDWDGNGWFAGTVEGTAMIIKSPNGTRFKITVSDEGTLSAAAITE